MSDSSIPKPGAPPGIRVVVSNLQAEQIDEPGLAALAEEVLSGEGASGELSLSFVEAGEMEELHMRYMGEDGPTDVLAFPMGEDGLLGDVVVCPEVAWSNNPANPAGELQLLVAHGVLHLLGHDHEDEEERRAMWAKQERYVGWSP